MTIAALCADKNRLHWRPAVAIQLDTRECSCAASS